MTRSSPKLIASIALGNALVPLNSTMIVVALPFIARDMRTDIASVSWLVTAYLIAMAALQPIGGRIGDRFGRRRVMLGALVYFAAASLGCALSQGLPMLVFFRLNQAVASALVAPNGLGILKRAAGDRAGTFFGLITAISGGAASIGPLIGGLLVGSDWRLIFLVNVPLLALTFGLALVNLPEETAKPETRFDLAGMVALGLILTTGAWTLTTLAHGVDATTLFLVVAVVVSTIAFVRYESGHADAALPPALFRIRAFTAANLSIGFANLALYGTLLAIPALLAVDPAKAVLVGVALFCLSVTQIVLAPLTGVLVDRFGARWPPAFGGLCIAVGSVATGAVVDGGSFGWLIASLLLTGSGISFTFPATRVAAVDAVPQRFVALASGIVSTSRYLAGMIAAILVGAVLTVLPEPLRVPSLFAVFAGAGVLSGLASLGMPGMVRREPVVAEVA